MRAAIRPWLTGGRLQNHQFEPFDLVFLGYLAVISILAACGGAWIYLPIHLVAAAVPLGLIQLHRKLGRSWTRALRHWYILPAVLLAFREIHYLVPRIHPFEDGHLDLALEILDRALFGDVTGFWIAHLTPLAADVLHLCYWSYFPALIAPAVWVYRNGDLEAFREYATLIVLGFFTSYLWYFMVPAVGPYVTLDPRPEVLDGHFLGGFLHRTLVALELRMPDAFPSGHALMYLLAIVGTARVARPLLPYILAGAIGCITATVALRYHYVVDVAVSVLLSPGIAWAAFGLCRKWR